MSTEKEELWTEDDDKKMKSAATEFDKDDVMVTVKADIMNARYHVEEETLIVLVRLANGEVKSLPHHARCFTFHGRKYAETPKDDIHREMKKTEELFIKARGKRLNVELSKINIGV